MKATQATALVTGLAFLSAALAASCPDVLLPTYNAPLVAPGWQAQLVVNGLRKPRTILIDSEGHLLVLDAGAGVRHISFTDHGSTCLDIATNRLMVDMPALNHGLAFSNDGKTLYASSVQSVFAWNYDAKTGSVSGPPTIVIDNMRNNDHVTRTLIMSQKKPGHLIVSRGSDEDLDVDTLDITSGLSQIKVFDLSRASSRPFNFNTEGRTIGWGLRNAVGVAEEPGTGNIYSLENSIDDIQRNGVDVGDNNPGEELNFHGPLSEIEASRGTPPNFGYPHCYALWDTNVPDNGNLRVGSQFSMTQNATLNDTTCSEQYQAPRLTFPAHTAPINLVFNNDGSKAFIAFRGAFNPERPVGYTLSTVDFARGTPVANSDSTNALSNIMSNPDISKCPDNCFRPVGLVFDRQNRLFMTSDSTGEIYVLQQVNPSPTTTASGTIITATGQPGAASSVWSRQTGVVAAAAVAVACLLAF